jgi:Galactose oxidase, central domain
MKELQKPGRPGLSVGAAVLAFTLIVVLGGLFPGGSFGGHPPPATASGPSLSLPSRDAVAAARSSLAAGGGPAAGVPWSCHPTGGGASCSAGPGTPRLPTMAPLNPGWSNLSFSPVARALPGGASLVYDAADGYVLLFGGTNGTLKGDTWSFAGGLWTHLHPKNAPSPRYGEAMAYDAPAGYVLLFGGYTGVTAFSDTWSFVSGQWSHLTPATTPAKLVEAMMAYDANDSYVVMFGGLIGPALTSLSHTTYTFFGGNWHVIAPATSPSGRMGGAMAFDALDGWVVLFGGYNATTSSYLGDTWNFTAGHWNNRTTGLAPSPRVRAFGSMAYDAADKAIILFGGQTMGGRHLGDTWSFAHGLWSHPTPAFAPSARLAQGLTAVSATGGVVLFGGERNTGFKFGDTWTYVAGVWKHILPPQPAPRGEAAMAYDEADGYVVLFGGVDTTHAFGDTWTFSGTAWHHLHPSIAPSARSSSAMAYDGADGYVVLFGGQRYSGGQLNDTWTFVAGTWSLLPPPTPGSGVSLPGAALAAMAYDAADGYLLLFGGTNGTGFRSHNIGWTYAFSGGDWTNVTPAISPVNRTLAGMAYDSWDGVVVLFGGEKATPTVFYLNDTWTWAAGVWTNVTAAVAPSVRAAFQITYDENHGYVLLEGGYNGNPTPFGDSWSFVGGVWVKLTPSTPAPPTAIGGIAFDAQTSTVVLFSGLGNVSTQYLDPGTWTY